MRSRGHWEVHGRERVRFGEVSEAAAEAEHSLGGNLWNGQSKPSKAQEFSQKKTINRINIKYAANTKLLSPLLTLILNLNLNKEPQYIPISLGLLD